MRRVFGFNGITHRMVIETEYEQQQEDQYQAEMECMYREEMERAMREETARQEMRDDAYGSRF